MTWPVIDADGHIRETDEEVLSYMGKAYASNREGMLYFSLVPMHGWHREYPPDGKTFRIPTLADWIQALDDGGLEAAVIYPSKFMHLGQIGIPDFAVELARGYNDLLYDRFLRHDPRLKGVALLPLQKPEAAAEELRRTVAQYGMVGGLLPGEGQRRPLGHSEYRPIFEEANRLGCLLAVHAYPSLRNNDIYLSVNENAALTHVIPMMYQFTSIMVQGVLDDLPNIRVAFMEGGSGWAPALISKIERRLKGDSNAVLPTELLKRRQIFFHCGEEMTSARDVELLGEHCLFWASDFPHESTLDMKKAVREFQERPDLSEAVKRKISYENPKAMYRI